MSRMKNFWRSVLSVLICEKYENLSEDDFQRSLLMMQKKKLGAHEIDMLFDLVLTWSNEILEKMNVRDGNTDSLEAARKWFETKVTAVKGIWWPQQYGVQYEVYSNAVRMSSYYLDIIDEKSREDVVEWLKLSKELTLKHIKFCLRRQKKKRIAFGSCFSGFSLEKFASRVDKFFFKSQYEDYEFFSEKPRLY